MSDHEELQSDALAYLAGPQHRPRTMVRRLLSSLEQLQSDLAAAQATIEAVKHIMASGYGRWQDAFADIQDVVSGADGAALEQVKADAWDEGYGSDTDVSTPRINPYRREGGTE